MEKCMVAPFVARLVFAEARGLASGLVCRIDRDQGGTSMGKGSRRLRACVLAAMLVGGLMVFAPGARGATVQDGPINYVGPGPCPVGTTDCLVTSGDVDVIQTAPAIGKNTIDCRGAVCKGVQRGSSATIWLNSPASRRPSRSPANSRRAAPRRDTSAPTRAAMRSKAA